MKLTFTFAKAIIVLGLAAASSHAGVIYSFTGTGVPFGPTPVAFQLTVPDFVNPAMNGPAVNFSCSQLDLSVNCGSQGVYFSNQSAAGSFSAQLQFDTPTAAYAFYFPTGAFGAVGSYTAWAAGNPGTLDVTQTPEPATLLFGFGGLCLFGISRLRRGDA